MFNWTDSGKMPNNAVTGWGSIGKEKITVKHKDFPPKIRQSITSILYSQYSFFSLIYLYYFFSPGDESTSKVKIKLYIQFVFKRSKSSSETPPSYNLYPSRKWLVLWFLLYISYWKMKRVLCIKGGHYKWGLFWEVYCTKIDFDCNCYLLFKVKFSKWK